MKTTTKKQAIVFESPIGLMVLIENNYITISCKGDQLCIGISGEEFPIAVSDSEQLEEVMTVFRDVIFSNANVRESKIRYQEQSNGWRDEDDWDSNQDTNWPDDDENDDWSE